MNYGIPYMGSKNRIAKDIIEFLPSGNRLVDLFGGGFAITHCAMLTSQKWNKFLYNDYNPLIVDLVKRSIAGEFNYDRFKPEFITREKFFEMKDKDGYVKYVWSFGNDGQSYLYGKDREEAKKNLHNFIIKGEVNSFIVENIKNYQEILQEQDFKKRRLLIKRDLPNELLQSSSQLERLQELERLERLQELEISNISYPDYKYKEGDIVYCDIPYEGVKKYSDKFNHQEFYDWCYNQPYTIYFSSYKISDDRFKKVWTKTRRSTLCATDNNVYREECIYCNK